MLYPLVPLFLRGTLGAPVFAVGLIEGVAESTASILKLVFGWCSDRFRARRSVHLRRLRVGGSAKPRWRRPTVWPVALLAARFSDRSRQGDPHGAA